MENNIFNISEIYVGKVISIDLDTHEIEVYIPKLMPSLSYGFSDTSYSVGLQSEVIKTNTLLCKPIDFKKRIPEPGSLVHVSFLDSDIKKIFWRDFDPFGTNTYIELELSYNEKVLQEFAEMFSMNNNSMIPLSKDIKLGSKNNEISQIFGYINNRYIVGLDDRVKKVLKDVGISESSDGTDISGLNQRLSTLETGQNFKADLVNGVVPIEQLPPEAMDSSTIIAQAPTPVNPKYNLFWVDISEGESAPPIAGRSFFFQDDGGGDTTPFDTESDPTDTSGDTEAFGIEEEPVDTSGDTEAFGIEEEPVDTSGDTEAFGIEEEPTDTSGDTEPFNIGSGTIDTSGDTTPFGGDSGQTNTSGDTTPFGTESEPTNTSGDTTPFVE